MDFNLEKIKTFGGSVSFLVDTMIQAGKHIFQREAMISKPSWLIQSEKFSSFFDRIKRKDEALDKLKMDVFRPVYENYESDFNSSLVNGDSVVVDDFLKIKDSEVTDVLRVPQPEGLYFRADKLYLPFSEIYSQILAFNKSHGVKNSAYPILLLIGLYTSVFNAVKEKETQITHQTFKANIQILLDSLEGCDGVPKRRQENNSMNMLQNLMGNFDFKQLSDMMGKVTGDEKASQEFGEVFGKMTESIKQGKNPLESMGEIIKNVSSRMEDNDPDVPVVKEEVAEEVAEEVTEQVVDVQLDPLPEGLEEETVTTTM